MEFLVLLGTFGIWGLLSIFLFIAVGILSTELDSALIGTLAVAIGLAALHHIFNVPVFTIMVANPFIFIVYVMAYLVVGSLYTAFWRWPEYIRNNKHKINDSYTQWALEQGSPKDNSFDAFLDSSEYEFNAWQHKERLGNWVGMWTFSAVWELSRKPTIWIWNILYKSLGKMFQRISHNTAKRMHEKG